MRVAFLLTQEAGGPVDLTVSLAGELARRPGGPEVAVVGPEPRGGAGEAGWQHRRAHLRSVSDRAGAAETYEALRGFRPDIVHAQDRRAALFASLVARRISPVVATVHGIPDGAAGLWAGHGMLGVARTSPWAASRLAATAILSRCLRMVVAPSDAMACLLRRDLRVPSRAVRAVHNGVGIPAPIDRPERVRTFATVSSFAPCKATPALVDGFAEVARRNEEVRLLMVGDGPDRSRCAERVRQHGVADKVELTGYRTDAQARLAGADAFVLPSLNENLPLALLEAMASGLPCIASRVGGVPEALSAESGILVGPGDHTALVEAMETLIGDPKLARRLGCAARRRVTTNFGLSSCADAHEMLWQDVLEGT